MQCNVIESNRHESNPIESKFESNRIGIRIKSNRIGSCNYRLTGIEHLSCNLIAPPPAVVMAPKKAKNDSHSHGIIRAEHTSAVADRKAMCERNIVKAIAGMTQQPKKTVIEVLGGLRSLAYAELLANEKFVIPQLVTIKIRRKPAMPARTKQVFGAMMVVKAKPATKVVKTLVAKNRSR